MIMSRHFVLGVGCLIVFCGTAWAIPPWPAIAGAGHDSLRGCRWRRCVIVRPMPRADDAVRLQPNLRQGPAFFQEIITDTKQSMAVMGQEVRQTQNQVFVLEWTPLGKNDAGHAVLRMKFIGVKMRIDIGGVRIDYCSWDDSPASNPMSEFFKKLIDSELTFIIDVRDSSIKTIDGQAELVKKVGAANPLMEPLLQSILNKDELSHIAAPMFGFLPKAPVRRGDSWPQLSALNLGPIGTYHTATKYTYVGKSGRYDRILAQTSLKYEAPKDKTGLPFSITKVDLKSTVGKGEILFDAARGRLVSSEMRLKLEGELTIEVGGMETKVGLAQTQRQRIRVTDTNPLPHPKD